MQSFEREPSEENQMEKIIGNKLMKNSIVEGDILVQPNVMERRRKRKILNEYDDYRRPTRWPNKTIPYEYDSLFCNLKILKLNLISVSFLRDFY